MNCVGELLSLLQVWLACFPPKQVGIRRERQTARDRIFDTCAGFDAEEPFRGAFTADELVVTLIDIAGQQLR